MHWFDEVMFHRFEEIGAWQEARKLANAIRVYRTRAVLRKDFGWEDQVGRSVLSIMANIAEGNDAKTNVEFINFLGYAKRSTAEVASHLYYGLDQGYVLPQEFTLAYESTRKIGAMIAKLVTYLRSCRQNNQRIGSGVHT
ncbi:four helix bundle protein [Candidatus Peribacteria bacterium]|nr:four helix bundle protein [Candidatus Peribacteria bacterium]